MRILSDQPAGALRDEVFGSAAFADAGDAAVGLDCDDEVALVTRANPRARKNLTRLATAGRKSAATLVLASGLVASAPRPARAQTVTQAFVNLFSGATLYVDPASSAKRQADAWRKERNLNYRIEVDGGIDFQTAAECAHAGADTFVSGTGLFEHRNFKAALRKMQKILDEQARNRS